MADVDIIQNGRGGTIYYRELHNVALFDWEFGGGESLALIFGQNAESWDRAYPWAAGRQQEVYDTLGAEVVRQQTNGGVYRVDLHNGWITIYSSPPSDWTGPRPEKEQLAPPLPKARRKKKPTASAAFQRFERSVPPGYSSAWPGDDATYDVRDAGEMTDAERDAAVEVLLSRGSMTWREVDALAALGTDLARLNVAEALEARLSVGTRLAAAEAARRWDPEFPIVAAIARDLKALHDPRDGLTRALRLAEAHDAPEVRRALLWASWNQTDCSSACAALLLRLTGADASDDVAERLGMHEGYFTRKAAFDELCARTGMTDADLHES